MYVYLGIDKLTGKKKRTSRHGLSSKRDAITLASKLVSDFNTLQDTYEPDYDILFADLYHLWFKQYKQRVKPQTAVNIENEFKLHILLKGRLLDVIAKQVTPAIAQRIVNDIVAELINFRHPVSHIKMVYDYGVGLGWLSANPFDNIIVPKRKASGYTPNVYTPEQLNIFLSKASELYLATDPRIYVFLRMLIYTGARKGEIMALNWLDIDFSNGIVSFNKTVATDYEGVPFISDDAKTSAGNRIVYLDADTLDYLARYAAISDNNIVFPSADGGLLRKSNPQRWIDRIVRRTGLPHVSPHGFRHAFVSNAIESGIPIKQVQKQVGHASVKITMDIYQHLTSEVQASTAIDYAELLQGVTKRATFGN